MQDPNLSTPRLAQVETDSDLLDYIYRGDLISLQDVLSHFDTSANARERLTRAFLSAVSNAPEQSLNLLLNTGLADLRAQDEINGRNCLHKAAMTGRKEFVRVGLNGKVDATQADAYGRIPLHYACMNGHVGLIQDLLQFLPETVEHKDLDNFTPLIHSIVNGHLHCVEMILAFSAGVDAAAETEHIPLNLACQHGSLPIVELLLRGKPHVLPDAEGLYPQHLVAKFGRDAELLMILRDYGASLDQTDKLYQWTPLLHAASEGKVECLKTLLNCGANPRAVDEKGLSALYYATWEGHLNCMVLLSSVADIPTAQRSSPLATVPLKKKGMSGSPSISASNESIPDLSLPPPIIPTRRYGHNFLDTKSTVLIMFGENGKQAVTFYDESKYPAARLTVAPRSSDIIPRNLLLPIQDEKQMHLLRNGQFG